MNATLDRIRRLLGRAAAPSARSPRSGADVAARLIPIEIPLDDPLITYLELMPEPVEVATLAFDSPSVRLLKQFGVKLILPLVSQGELVGAVYLGQRMGEQDYTSDDISLLKNLVTQTAPSVRVAQMVKQQQAEALQRERIESELRVAQFIQKSLLPKEAPDIPGWNIQGYYKSAREVGGDLYDFLALPDGRLGIVIGDVTDKGIPSALMMASTRSTLRAAALTGAAPGEVLRQTNERLCPDMPERMFVTCSYAVLNTRTGELTYANAGHLWPFRCCGGEASQIMARGMPLGLLPDARYEECTSVVEPGALLLFYSDGLVEAHNPAGEMFGLDRLAQFMAAASPDQPIIDQLLNAFTDFTGADWDQEDDVTIVTFQRTERASPPPPLPQAVKGEEAIRISDEWRTLTSFAVPSEQGKELVVITRLEKDLAPLNLPQEAVDALKTAVAEAAMNAIEHGNQLRPDLQVEIEAVVSEHELIVRVADQGLHKEIRKPEAPDLYKKLAGEQSPRGWGLFLMEQLVDELRVQSDASHHTVELVMRLPRPEEE